MSQLLIWLIWPGCWANLSISTFLGFCIAGQEGTSFHHFVILWFSLIQCLARSTGSRCPQDWEISSSALFSVGFLMTLLILKFPLCSLHWQWSPAGNPLPKLWRGRCQVGWAPGYEWQGGLLCQEPLSRDRGWKVHWISLTKCLQLSVALQGAVTPSFIVPLAAMEGFSDGPCYCGVSVFSHRVHLWILHVALQTLLVETVIQLKRSSSFWSRRKGNKLVPYSNLLWMLFSFCEPHPKPWQSA